MVEQDMRRSSLEGPGPSTRELQIANAAKMRELKDELEQRTLQLRREKAKGARTFRSQIVSSLL
jgi:hypothetical protein